MSTIQRIDLKKETATIHELLIKEHHRTKFVIDFNCNGKIFSDEEKRIIILNIWENYPFKSLKFQQNLDGKLIADEYTNNLLTVIKQYLECQFKVDEKDYLDHSGYQGYFEDFRFDIFYRKPSDVQNINFSRIQQF